MSGNPFSDFSENVAFIQAIKNKRLAEEAMDNNIAWENAYKRLKQDVDFLLKAVEKRDEVIGQLKEQVSIQNASYLASDKVWESFAATHPESPLRKVIGTRKDGKPLTKARQIWIETFDRIARELGIKNPEKHRVG